MTITEQQLRAMMPLAGARLTPHLAFINPALEWGNIVTPPDVTAFMAHLAHESGEYRYMREIADGSDYEGRIDLGNIYPGDGRRYPGRGPIQVTGRDAARAAGHDLGAPFEEHPEMMELPEWGTKVAVWFWTRYKPTCQAAAKVEWFHVTQRLVNGGENGWAERVAYYQRNRAMFAMAPYRPSDEDASIRAFQAVHGLVVDGAVGSRTLAALLGAAGPVPHASLDDARAIQAAVGVTVDGVIGAQSLAAIRKALHA